MPSITLHFENARRTQQVFAGNPRNLAAVAAQLGVKATAREGWIKLEGEADALERAQQLFQTLEQMIHGGHPVQDRDFLAALDVAKEEGGSALKGLQSTRIITSPKKPSVVPKTSGQKKYVDAIREHDITFGIGPAGTGKTYLAMAMALSALREGEVGRIILTRPAVEAGEALGFLPGDLQEKLAPYLRPLHDAFSRITSCSISRSRFLVYVE